MIIIEDKRQCCGCNACVQYCPKSCITMQEDEEGFLYPIINKTACIDCGLCEKVCPVLNQKEEREPLKVYAAKNKNDEIRMQSSSGGIFTLLAEQIIQEGGVVFGARFNDDWEVIHDYTETIDGIAVFRGSKYVQSQIGETYKQAKQFLKQGRKVMFTGTPCQIAGLKQFLKKEYENLFAVDFICHGVPSPMVWRRYLHENMQRLGSQEICSIEFRNKKTGWKHYSFSITYIRENKKSLSSELYTCNPYMKGYLADLYLRPACYSCPSKNLKSGSDITLGDFWGVQNIKPDIDDNKGIEVVLLNTNKVLFYIHENEMIKYEITYKDVYDANPALIRSAIMPYRRNDFYRCYWKSAFVKIVSEQTRLPIILRCKIFVYDLLVKLKLIK